MKKTLLFCIGLLISTPVLAKTSCFLVTENDKVIQQEGDCNTRHSPNSTFKIALSLMGFDHGVLIDETQPIKPFLSGYPDYIEKWKQPHHPRLWMENSCLWYSQFIAQKLGMNTFKSYINKFNYGNKDLSGDIGKDNGLTHAWLDSSLKISPQEQVVFLRKLLNQQLSLQPRAYTLTQNILFIEDFADGWKLNGKTGSGNLLKADGTPIADRKTGWFIGWLQKGDRKIIFAHYIQDEEKQNTYGGPRAKEIAKGRLKRLIESQSG